MHSRRMRTTRCNGHFSCYACPTYHTPPLPCMPPATHAPSSMHAPHHTHPLPGTPPLPCMPMPPCHTCPPATHAPLPHMPPAAPPGQNSSHTLVKTLPCRNFIATHGRLFIITRMHSRRMRTTRCNGHFSCYACPTYHTQPPLPCMPMPPATHALLPHMPPCHTCPPATHAPLPHMPPADPHSPHGQNS